jgi:WD40 repeat protein/serine/threonine protein kinase
VAEWSQLEPFLERFESAWRRGERPVLDEYLPVADIAERRAILVELIHTELEYRLKAGEAARVEDYLRRYPDLARERAVLLDLLAAEWALRARNEPELQRAEYDRRFPEYGGELAALIDATPMPAGRRIPAEDIPKIVGYEVLGVLGRGGMGVVYRARQKRPRRLVALKMLRGRWTDPGERARFLNEAEAVARLQHPNIVQVHAAGEQDGQPYLVLEFVPGGTLAQQLAGGPLPAQPAAHLVETLARATHFAHCQGIIHRDLKPANVLLRSKSDIRNPNSASGDTNPVSDVGCRMADFEPKITDFGLAKQLEEEGPTATEAILGTPSYMAPEQAAGRSKAIGPAADTYALGAILYETLTGRPPFRAPTMLETLEQVRTQDPLPPSRLQPTVPRDLETICLKCLRKEPGQRYATAAELADDLQRFQKGEPILARPTPRWERLVKWARRRPALAGLVAVSSAAAAAIVVMTLHSNAALKTERDLATAESSRAQKAETEARAQTQVANEKTEAAQREFERAEAEVKRARRQKFALQLTNVDARREYDPAHGLELLDDTEYCPFDLRDFTWRYLWRACQRQRRTLLRNSVGANVRSVAFAPDGKAVAATLLPFPAVAWRVDKETPLVVMQAAGQAQAAVFAWDGSLYVGCNDGTIKRCDAQTGDVSGVRKGHTRAITWMSISADGKWLVSCAVTLKLPEVFVWDLSREDKPVQLPCSLSYVNTVAISPAGKLVAAAGDNVIHLWDVGTGKSTAVLKQHQGPVFGLAFSPDARLLASAGPKGQGSGAGEVKLWDPVAGRELVSLPGLHTRPNGVAFSPDSRLVAAGTGDLGDEGEVRLWDATTYRPRVVLRSDTGPVNAVAFSPDGRILVAGGDRQSVKLWDLPGDQEKPPLQMEAGDHVCMALSPDGATLAIGSKLTDLRNQTPAQLWDAATGKLLTGLHTGTQQVYSLAFSFDGARLAVGSNDGSVQIWNGAGTTKEATYKGQKYNRVLALAFSRDGRVLAAGGHDRFVKVFDLVAGKEVAALAGFDGDVLCVAVAPDGGTVAAGSADGTLGLLDVATGQERHRVKAHTGAVHSVAWSSDGSTLATGSHDTTIKLWNCSDYSERATLSGHGTKVIRVAFSPTDAILASASQDGEVRLWDATTGQLRTLLAGLPVAGMLVENRMCSGPGVAWTADGNRLAALGQNGSVKFWEGALPAGQPLATLRGHQAGVIALTRSPDGRIIASGSADGVIKLWDATTGQRRASVQVNPGGLVGLVFMAESKLLAAITKRGEVKLWRMPSSRTPLTEEASIQAFAGDVRCFALAPDGNTLAVGGVRRGDAKKPAGPTVGGVAVWDLTGRREKTTFAYSLIVTALAFSPDGQQLAVAGDAGDLAFWEVANIKERAALPVPKQVGQVASLAWAPDGKTLAAGVYAGVMLWDVAKREIRSGILDDFRPIQSLAWSPDGKTLATGHTAGLVKLWDPATSRLRRGFDQHNNNVNSLVFTPDGRMLLTGSEDRTVKFWKAAE